MHCLSTAYYQGVSKCSKRLARQLPLRAVERAQRPGVPKRAEPPPVTARARQRQSEPIAQQRHSAARRER